MKLLLDGYTTPEDPKIQGKMGERNTQGISTEVAVPPKHGSQEKARTQRERSRWGIKIKQSLATCSGRNHSKVVSMETDDAGWKQVNGERGK